MHEMELSLSNDLGQFFDVLRVVCCCSVMERIDQIVDDTVVCRGFAQHLGVWCAHYGAGRLTRYAPDGAVLAVIDVPCPVVTSMGFGGPDMTTLYVTTGWSPGIQRAEDEQGPGGALLTYETGIRGLPEPAFDPA